MGTRGLWAKLADALKTGRWTLCLTTAKPIACFLSIVTASVFLWTAYVDRSLNVFHGSLLNALREELLLGGLSFFNRKMCCACVCVPSLQNYWSLRNTGTVPYMCISVAVYSNAVCVAHFHKWLESWSLRSGPRTLAWVRREDKVWGLLYLSLKRVPSRIHKEVI